MIGRALTSAGLVALSFWAPWQVLFLGIVLATLLVRDYYEGVAIAIFFDLLYGNQAASGFPIATALTIGALAAGPFLRARLRWYS